MKTLRLLMTLAIIAAFLSPVLPADVNGIFDGPASARAALAGDDDWKAEFDDICSRTQDAMAYTVDELRDLVARCDELKKRFERLEGTEKKVYLKRLDMCRGVFAFTLEAKETEKAGN